MCPRLLNTFMLMDAQPGPLAQTTCPASARLTLRHETRKLDYHGKAQALLLKQIH